VRDAQADKFGYKDSKLVLVQEPSLVLDNLEAGMIENFRLLSADGPISRSAIDRPTTSRCSNT
jgi:hypothetical protein